MAISHFVNCGMNDGRIASPNFDVKSYRNANSDLRSIFGKNYKSYFIHYMNYGSNEGRTATGVSKITNGITSWNGKDYSKVYNFDYYTSHYADVNNIFGDDDTLAIQHFIYCGEKEERVASKTSTASLMPMLMRILEDILERIMLSIMIIIQYLVIRKVDRLLEYLH